MIEVSKKRLKFLDDAKGLGMMMIVWMHIWGNNTFEFAPPELLNSYITGIYVPLFFVLSGYLVRIERVNIENDIKKKVKSVLRPFLVVYLFSFISSFILFVMGIGTKHDFEWGNVFNPIFSKSFFNGPLWFLLALFWAFVFFYTIITLCRGKAHIISIASLAFGCIGFYLSRTGVTLPLFMGQGAVACPMLMMGCMIKKYIGDQLVKNKWLATSVLFLGILIYVLLRMGISMHDNAYNGFYLQFLFGVLGGSMAVLCFTIIFEKWLPFVEYWGKYSLVVLCFHNFVLIPCARIAGKLIHQPIIWALATFLVVYLCFKFIIPVISKYTQSLFNIKT